MKSKIKTRRDVHDISLGFHSFLGFTEFNSTKVHYPNQTKNKSCPQGQSTYRASKKHPSGQFNLSTSDQNNLSLLKHSPQQVKEFFCALDLK